MRTALPEVTVEVDGEEHTKRVRSVILEYEDRVQGPHAEVECVDGTILDVSIEKGAEIADRF